MSEIANKKWYVVRAAGGKEKKAKGQPKLTKEMLAKIGEAIEQKKVKALESAGLEQSQLA